MADLLSATPALTTPQIVGLTIWGEARSLPLSGRLAVAQVIQHRVLHPKKKYGAGWSDVCLKPWQFSCWVEAGGKANFVSVQSLAAELGAGVPIVTPSAWTECLWLAEGVMDSAFRDTVFGADHYLTRELLETNAPAWARGVAPVAEVGPHVFFRLG